MRSISRLILTVACLFFLFPVTVSAAPTIPSDLGLGMTAGAAKAGGTSLSSRTNLSTIVGTVLGAALSLLAVIFFILTVFAGFLWMTAHGKEDQITKAKDILIGATIGLFITLGSYTITRFVFEAVEGGPSEFEQARNAAEENAQATRCTEQKAAQANQAILCFTSLSTLTAAENVAILDVIENAPLNQKIITLKAEILTSSMNDVIIDDITSCIDAIPSPEC